MLSFLYTDFESMRNFRGCFVARRPTGLELADTAGVLPLCLTRPTLILPSLPDTTALRPRRPETSGIDLLEVLPTLRR